MKLFSFFLLLLSLKSYTIFEKLKIFYFQQKRDSFLPAVFLISFRFFILISLNLFNGAEFISKDTKKFSDGKK